MSEAKPTPVLWKPGKCNVPMWTMGAPSGFCLQPANGPQLPQELLGWANRPYCHGHCCPSHGGPQDGEPIVFQDGCTEEGRPMWCAVMPDFVNLHESPAGFSGSAVQAVHTLRAALSKARPNTAEGEAQGQATAGAADPQLLKFYGVSTDAELIAAQARHIERLQAKLPQTPSLAPQRVREG